jgi:hypothetical protein
MPSLVRYEIRNVPEDLPPGRYGSRVSDESRWESGQLVIILTYDPAIHPDDCALAIVKE